MLDRAHVGKCSRLMGTIISDWEPRVYKQNKAVVVGGTGCLGGEFSRCFRSDRKVDRQHGSRFFVGRFGAPAVRNGGGSLDSDHLSRYLMDVSWDDYLPAANSETCVIVQIETLDGMRNLEEIAAVEGVDVVFAGPMDLSAAFGHIGQSNHPTVQQFLADFPRRVNAFGKAAGITFADLDACKTAYEQGYRFVAFGSILSHGTRGLTAELKQLREIASSRV